MAKVSAGPWLRASNGYYYVTIKGKQTRLSKDKETAYAMWHQLMAGKDENDILGISLVALANSYLTHQKTTKSSATLENSQRWVVSFVDFIEEPIKDGVLAKDVTPKHVLMWMHGQTNDGQDIREVNKTRRKKKQKVYQCKGAFQSGYENVSNNTHVAAFRAIAAMFNYGIRTREYKGDNPVNLIPDKPQYTPRETYITNDDWERIIDAIDPENPLRDLVLFIRCTGCRPGEARKAGMEHFDRETRTLKWSNKERGKLKNRKILLNDEALSLFLKWAMKYPTGPAFRNREGNPWSSGAVVNGFIRISNKTGIKVTAYTIRHSFCTNALKAGESTYDVAKLMGHADTKMVEQVYGHMQLEDDRFREASKRIADAQKREKPEQPPEDDNDDNLRIHHA
ncbi:MAG: site-specific integrase [Planctomycetaceae bacterium]|nr:site-specific integrase [Planctomycetaceae bacterium]